jgi:hypothetical protein
VTGPEATPAAEHKQAWEKARRHLAEAEAMDLAQTLAAAVHSA